MELIESFRLRKKTRTDGLIRKIAEWDQYPRGEVDFWFTQVLSDHSCFGAYRSRFKERDTPGCQMHGNDWNDAEHALFVYTDTRVSKRIALEEQLGSTMTPARLVSYVLRERIGEISEAPSNSLSAL